MNYMVVSPKHFSFNPILLVVFIALGIGFIFLSVYLYLDTVSFTRRAYKTEGRVIERVWQKQGERGGYSPRIEFYDANGIRREFMPRDTTVSPSFWGDTYSILFDPQNPSEARINTFSSLWLRILGPFCVGLMFFSVGVGILYNRHRRKSIVARLKSFGDIIYTHFVRLDKLELMEKSSQSAWRIISSWCDPETGQDYEFKSDDILVPNGNAPIVGVKTIAVYIDPKDPKRHYMDISFLEN